MTIRLYCGVFSRTFRILNVDLHNFYSKDLQASTCIFFKDLHAQVTMWILLQTFRRKFKRNSIQGPSALILDFSRIFRPLYVNFWKYFSHDLQIISRGFFQGSVDLSFFRKYLFKDFQTNLLIVAEFIQRIGG